MNKKKAAAGLGAAAVLAVAAILLLKSGAGGILGASGGMAPGGQGGRGGMPGEEQEASYTIVKAAVPYTGNVSVTSGLTGTVEAADLVYIYAKASGDVTAVHIQAGDIVSKGQALMEIDTEQVESALNSLESAQVSYREAQSDLQRMQILYQGGDLSEQEYEQYQNKVTSARLQYESAKINYDKQVEYSSITSPIAGRVESCDAEVYDRVSQSTQLCVIAGEGDSRITFYVSQRMRENLTVGDELSVVKNGKEYKGWLTEISTMVDEDTGLFKIKAELEDTEEIAIGSTVRINLVTDKAENVMLVPVDAIYYSGGNGYVYLYKDGYAVMAPVEVGLYDDVSAEILSGIQADDMVVSTWSSNLYEGARIRLVSELEAEEAAGGEGAGPEGGQPDAGNMPEGGQPDAGNMPEGGQPDAGDMPEGGQPDAENLPDGSEPQQEQ